MRWRASYLSLMVLCLLLGFGAVAAATTSDNSRERLMMLATAAFLLCGALFTPIPVTVRSRPPTPTLGHDPATHQPALMFPENPRRVMLGLALSLLFVLLCIAVIAYYYSDLAAEGEGRRRVRGLVAVVASVLGIPLFGGAAVILYGRLRNPLPTLTITPAGVQVLFINRRTWLEWSQIEAVRSYEQKGDVGVAFLLSESVPKPFSQRLTRWGMGECDIAVSLGGNPEPVVALLEFYRTHPEHRHEIGTPACLERYQATLSGGGDSGAGRNRT